MFLGRFEHNLDDKYRITIPARFREGLVEGVYLTQGFDGNIMAMPPHVFDLLSKRLNALNMADDTSRALRRLIFSNASMTELDKAGRILLPVYLRELANIEQNVIIVGMGGYIEIWKPEAWHHQLTILNDPNANAQRFNTLDLSDVL